MIDPYLIGENQHTLTDSSYISAQADLNGESRLNRGSAGIIEASNIHNVTFRYGTDKKLSHGLVALELTTREGLGHAELKMTFNNAQGSIVKKLTTITGSDYPLTSNEFMDTTHIFDSLFLDSNGDGYKDQLITSYNGQIQVYALDNLTEHVEQPLQAIDKITPNLPLSNRGRVSITKGNFDAKPGEELAYSTKSFQGIYGTPGANYCSGSEFKIIRIGNEDHKTLYNGSLLEDNLCPQAITEAKIKSNTVNTQLAVGGVYDVDGDKTFNENVFGVRLYDFVLDVETDTLTMTRIANGKWTEEKWKYDTAWFQHSIASADLLGIGTDYVAYASKVFTYDLSHSGHIKGVKRFDLGSKESSKIAMVWTSGNFSDDFNEYVTGSIIEAVPGEDQLIRHEGEELILARVKSNYNPFSLDGSEDTKYSFRTSRLVDIDNSVFSPVRTVNDAYYSELGGVNVDYIKAPVFFASSNIEHQQPWVKQFPSFSAVDVNASSVAAVATNSHSVKLAAPSLIQVIEPVPYYGAIYETMKPSQSMTLIEEQGSVYSVKNSISMGSTIEAVTPVLSASISNSLTQSFAYSSEERISEVLTNTNNMGSAFLNLEVVPFDSFEYRIIYAPSSLEIRGETFNTMFPREPLYSFIDMAHYDDLNDSLDSGFQSYTEQFPIAGDIENYPSMESVKSDFPNSYVTDVTTVPPSHENSTTIGVILSKIFEAGQGGEEELAISTSVGLAFKGFGFNTSESYAYGLETTALRSWGKGQTYNATIFGTPDPEEFPVYSFGLFLTKDQNPTGAKESFIRTGFYIK